MHCKTMLIQLLTYHTDQNWYELSKKEDENIWLHVKYNGRP